MDKMQPSSCKLVTARRLPNHQGAPIHVRANRARYLPPPSPPIHQGPPPNHTPASQVQHRPCCLAVSPDLPMPVAAWLLLLLLLAQAAGRQGWAGGLSCRLLLGPPADRGHNSSCLGKYAFKKASTRLNHGSAKYVTWHSIGRLLVDRGELEACHASC
jgi:hypothetical protein